MTDSVLVLGAGLAGLRTAAELRERGFAGRLTVVGAETQRPYDRPPLSKELLTRLEPLGLEADLGTDLSAVADEVLLGVTATGLDAATGAVTLADGGTRSADAVVVATGAAPLNPWPDALTLHTADDADRLRAALAPGARLAVIGAGWVGAEVAGVAAAAGHEVTVIEAGPEPLWRQLGAATGALLRPWFAGVDLRAGHEVVAVTPAGEVALADGSRVLADVVLSAVGVRPATAWLAGAVELADSGHVPVDATGHAAGRVWAVGDAAERHDPRFGVVPGGHWFAALRDPARVAAALTGTDPGPAHAPEVFSDQLGHHLEAFGLLDGDTVIQRGGPGGPWLRAFLRDGALVGAVVADSPRDTSAVRKALARPDLPRPDLEALADPTQPLRQVLA